MNPPRYLLDSNILLRFFTGEPASMFAASSSLIASAERGEVVLELSPLVLAETAFTLESFFKRPRKEVAGALVEFIKRSGVRLAEKDRLLDALERIQKIGIHFVDAYLAATSAETKLPMASFDRDFDRFPDVQRFEHKAF
jgi:predicted nucleic acid-binding protein